MVEPLKNSLFCDMFSVVSCAEVEARYNLMVDPLTNTSCRRMMASMAWVILGRIGLTAHPEGHQPV